MPSLKLVKPFMSQKKMVISRREPLASVSSGRSSSPATMRGSTYLPKVSRICALIRSSPTMLLKDRVSRPISSREVIGMTVSSAPTLDRGGAGEQAAYRSHQPEGDGGSHDDAQRRGYRQEREADVDNALLV